jgi:hypothetical protein
MEQVTATQRSVKSKLAVVAVILVLAAGGGMAAFGSPDARIKAKFGTECKVQESCRDMMYVDCNAAADGPAYYVTTGRLEVIGTSGGLCMAGHCSGAPKEWQECIKARREKHEQ